MLMRWPQKIQSKQHKKSSPFTGEDKLLFSQIFDNF